MKKEIELKREEIDEESITHEQEMLTQLSDLTNKPK